MLKKRVRVAGLDLAAANSGVAILEATTLNGQPPLELTPIHTRAVRTEMNQTETLVEQSRLIVEECVKHCVDFVVIEDYIKRFGKGNTTGLNQAELVGMVKLRLHEANVPYMIVNPSQMRSFMNVQPKDKKQAIMDNAYDRWGLSSDASRKGDRSNIIDASCHAVIGACVYFASHGHLTSNLTTREKRVLYGDDLKMQGLKDKLPENVPGAKPKPKAKQEEKAKPKAPVKPKSVGKITSNSRVTLQDLEEQ